MSLIMSALDPNDPAREHLAFLSSSPERLALLTELRDQLLSSTELCERADVSSETAQKLLETGIRCNWIVEDAVNECYELTTAGELIYQAYVGTQRLDRELLAFLITSATRLSVLERIEGDSLSAVELSNRLPADVSTVYRALNILEDRGLLDWQNEPELTVAGKEVYNEYQSLVDTVGWIMAHAETLNHLGDVGETLPAEALAQSGGNVISNSIANPDAVLDHFETRIRALSPERVRCVLPSMCAFIDRVGRPLLERGAELEVVIDEAVLDVTRSLYPQALSAVVDAESAELLIHPEKLRFGLAILNGSTFVFVYDEQSLVACLETTTEALNSWATEVFRTRYRAARN